MDVLSKLRSTVTNTVSQISGVLPGNPVTREFEVTNHSCSAGPGTFKTPLNFLNNFTHPFFF